MKKTLEVLNKLVDENVIRDYAIGGAMGALWYMVAITTICVSRCFCAATNSTGKSFQCYWTYAN